MAQSECMCVRSCEYIVLIVIYEDFTPQKMTDCFVFEKVKYEIHFLHNLILNYFITCVGAIHKETFRFHKITYLCLADIN